MKRWKENKKMKTIELYLGHPLDIRKEIRKWELSIEKKINVSLINPFYDPPRKDILRFDRGEVERYDYINPVRIVEDDLNKIKKSSGGIYILGDFKKIVSIGTLQEMVYAKIFGKLIYALVLNNHAEHPWIKYHSTNIFTSWEDIENFLINKFGLKENAN